MHCRVLIEERQEYDDALNDGRLHLGIESCPGVEKPSLDRFEPVSTIAANRIGFCTHFEWNLVSREEALQLRFIRVCELRFAQRYPQRPPSVPEWRLKSLAADRQDVRRGVKLRL